jgi:hypothetical protein
MGFVTTPLKGWMMKSNLLVRAKPDSEGQWLAAYQILSLDFENGIGGKTKVVGARQTQRVPSSVAVFKMSDGVSGTTNGLPLVPGSQYEALVTGVADGFLSDANAQGGLLKVTGTLAPLTEEEHKFAKFVVSRPHKVLAQENGSTAAYAPEDGDGAYFTAEGVMKIETTELNVEGALRRLGLRDKEGISVGIDRDAIDLSKAIVLLQPEYTLLDHTNIPI